MSRPPKLGLTELNVTRFCDLDGWQDEETRAKAYAQVVADLAYAAHIRGMRFDHAWPLVNEALVDPLHPDHPTTVMLYGRVWAVPRDEM